MKKILATLKKEWVVLKHDISGLLLLMIMPAILLIVMALVQDAPFKDFQEKKITLLVVDEDLGNLSQQIIEKLNKSQSFEVVQQIDGTAINQHDLEKLLRIGKYNVGIVIPKGGTAEMVNSANFLANHVMTLIGNTPGLPQRESRDSIKVNVFFDPITKPTFRMSIAFALDRIIGAASAQMLFERLGKMNSSNNLDNQQIDTMVMAKLLHGIGIQEGVLSSVDGTNPDYEINSVQHNVPAWSIFGIFMIVIPIVGGIIRERSDGSALRIKLIPGSKLWVYFGKISFYVLVCFTQFVLMMLIGKFVMPIIGLSALHIGNAPFALCFIVFSISFAATAFGHMIGQFFTTVNQALPFAAIIIVILSALSGIWVPIDLLGTTMQKIANISPLYWGLRGVNDIFLRNGNFNSILLESCILIAFGLVFWLVGSIKRKYTQEV